MRPVAASYIDRSTTKVGHMSDAREDINDPRIYDETDDLLVEFSALVSIYTDKPEAIETESDLLHRWIPQKRMNIASKTYRKNSRYKNTRREGDLLTNQRAPVDGGKQDFR